MICLSCLNVYLPWSSDNSQAPKMCAVVHTSLLHRMHMASVVILHLLRLVKDGSVAYVEARRPRNILLNLVHPSCPLALNLQLNSFGQGISIIFCSVVDGNISPAMFSRFVFRDFWCSGVSKPMPATMADSTDLIGFYVVFTRQNHIFNLPSTSLVFRDAARN